MFTGHNLDLSPKRGHNRRKSHTVNAGMAVSPFNEFEVRFATVIQLAARGAVVAATAESGDE